MWKILAVSSLLFQYHLVYGTDIVIPNGLEATEADSGSPYPFQVAIWPSTARYQQVYASSQFSSISKLGWVIGLNFRIDSQFFAQNFTGFQATFTNIEIRCSSTARTPDELSTNFIDNIGLDQMVVYSNRLAISSSFHKSQQPQNWEIAIPFERSFRYSPAFGNLLLDIIIHEGHDSLLLVPAFDAANADGDSVSCVYSTSANTPSGSASTLGMATLFEIIPDPSLTVFVSNPDAGTNFIVARWPSQPTGFVLQESPSLASNAVWKTLSGVDSNADFSEYRIPVYSILSNSFLRLLLMP